MFILILIYIAFISLGLPDSVLGSAWTAIRTELGAQVSLAGVISLIVSAGTVVSSLLSTRMIARFGTAKVTAVSVAMTAAALFGFGAARSVALMCVLAVPLGLGGGSVDSALNNYVALRYKARHMNWLHCFWGIGASAGPMIMALWLGTQGGWRGGYLTIAAMQSVLAAVLFASLPAWKRADAQSADAEIKEKPKLLTLRQAARVPLAAPTFIALFCYCALELTAGLWSASYATLLYGTPKETAAGWTSLFYLGLTAGRAAAGFLSMKLDNPAMIRLGQAAAAAGAAVMLVPLGEARVPVSLVLLGLGCAPIYPAMLHQTPRTFGAEKSQAMLGIQMASAYCGSTLMPPLFGFLAQHVSMALLPVYLAALLALMTVCTEIVRRRVSRSVS